MHLHQPPHLLPAQIFRSECTKKLGTLKPHATFLTLHYYINVESGKVADWSIVFHISYQNALYRSIEILEETKLKLSQTIGKPYSFPTLKVAKDEMLHSYYLSLRGENVSTSEHAYHAVHDAFNHPIPGVKLHREQDLLHMYGFVVYCREYLPGIPDTTEHSTLTLAKKDLLKLLPLSRFVQFRLEPMRFQKLVVNNMTITDQEVIRQAFSKNKIVKVDKK